MIKIPTPQETLIGAHPVSPNFFATWLQHEDCAVPSDEPHKKHRKLNEIAGQRDAAIEQLAEWIFKHHISDSKLRAWRKQRLKEIYQKHGLDSQISTLPPWFPKSDTTKAGNATEVLMSEYLESSSGLTLLIFRLRYNPNVDQSMKGDDALCFNRANIFEKVLVGESKFRSTAAGAAVDEILEWMNTNRRYPVSIGFVAEIIENEDADLSEQLYLLEADIHARKCSVINAGFFLSQPTISASGVAKVSDGRFKPNHEQAVLISLGLDNPKEIVEKAFENAWKLLKNAGENPDEITPI